jgi:hypothetical protein
MQRDYYVIMCTHILGVLKGEEDKIFREQYLESRFTFKDTIFNS